MRKQRLSAFFSLPMVLVSAALALSALGVQLSQSQPVGSSSSSKTGRKGHPSAPASSTAAGRTVALSAPPASTVPPPAPPPPPPAPPPPPPSTTTTAPAPDANAVADTSSLAGGVWAELRQCESGGDYQDATGNGFYGAYQFTDQTWSSLGLSGNPSQASPSVQDQAARQLQARDGWGPWPSCSRKLGLS